VYRRDGWGGGEEKGEGDGVGGVGIGGGGIEGEGKRGAEGVGSEIRVDDRRGE